MWLKGVITRMVACAVEIHIGNNVYFGSLIESGYENKETGRYVIILNPKLARLFRGIVHKRNIFRLTRCKPYNT